MRHSSLSANELAFAVFYARTPRNGTKAAIAAGYSPRTAAVQAHRLIRRPGIREEIERQSAHLSASRSSSDPTAGPARAPALVEA